MSADLETVHPGSPWGAWPTLGYSLLTMVLMLMVSTAVLMIAMVQQLAANPGTDPAALVESMAKSGDWLAITTLIANTIGVVFIYACVRWRRTLSFQAYLDFHPVGVKAYLIWNGLLAIFLVFSEALSRATQHTEPFMEQLFTSTSQPVLLFLAVVVAAPIFEEILFRGFMLPGLKRSRLGVWGAILLTSLLWAVIHFQYGWFGIGTIFMMGILLGYAHVQTRSIYVPISMHALNNLLAFVLTFYTLS